ncbi:MAG: DUF3800 domain-containing protein [Gemmatimonadaceae bacterium]
MTCIADPYERRAAQHKFDPLTHRLGSMAFFLFIDESGHDRGESPYEVLAGIAVEDRDLWNLIDDMMRLEREAFGLVYSRQKDEIKGKKILKRKVFRHAAQLPAIDPDRRRHLAREFLLDGAAVTKEKVTALAQAKLWFVREALNLCLQFHCHAFASIVTRDAPRPVASVLRKDYAYLFERFYYFLEDRGRDVQGLIVFDELEKTQSKILLGQMEEYFLRTANGRQRARQVIPQAFFVHSDLTTMIQVADLIAYIISWAFRIPEKLDAPARQELGEFADLVAGLRYRTVREKMGNPNFTIWSFAAIDNLRSIDERTQGA